METALHIGLIVVLIAILTTIILGRFEKFDKSEGFKKFKNYVDIISLIYAVVALIILFLFTWNESSIILCNNSYIYNWLK